MALTGVASLFASTDIAMPFLLESMQIPSDPYKLFVLTGTFNPRFAVLLAGMNLFTFTLLATCMITGLLSINWRKLISYVVVNILLISGFVIGTRFLLGFTVADAFSKDKVIVGMHLLQNPVPSIVHKTAPPVFTQAQSGKSDLKAIKERGVLRFGYNADRMPFTILNSSGDLVRFDVEMAHRLARELGVTLEFIPFEGETMVQQSEDGQFDMVHRGYAHADPHIGKDELLGFLLGCDRCAGSQGSS